MAFLSIFDRFFGTTTKPMPLASAMRRGTRLQVAMPDGAIKTGEFHRASVNGTYSVLLDDGYLLLDFEKVEIESHGPLGLGR